jgi:hypothetical protein
MAWPFWPACAFLFPFPLSLILDRLASLALLQTIALIAVREGVVQLGSMKKVGAHHRSPVVFFFRAPDLSPSQEPRRQHVQQQAFVSCRVCHACRRVARSWLCDADTTAWWVGRLLDGREFMQVAEDLSYVVMLRRKFGYLESIPGVLLPHPSTAGVFPGGGCVGPPPVDIASAGWPGLMPPPAGPSLELYDPYGAAVAAAGPAAAAAASMHIMPSMSSLEALLSKLPSVVPAPQAQPPAGGPVPGVAPPANKEEEEEEPDDYARCHGMDVASNGANGGESTSTSAATAAGAVNAPMPSYFVNVGSSSNPGEGF